MFVRRSACFQGEITPWSEYFEVIHLLSGSSGGNVKLGKPGGIFNCLLKTLTKYIL